MTGRSQSSRGTQELPLSAPVVIVIWTLASELSSPGTQALTGAAHEALGPDAQIVLKGASPTADDQELATAGPATSVVHLTWDTGEHRRARIVCYLPKTGRWLERQITFSQADPEVERGRTLGFFLASMFLEAGVVPEPRNKREPARPDESESEQKKEQASAVSQSGPESTRSSASRPSSPEPAKVTVRTAETTPVSSRNTALTLAAVSAFPGTSTGFGVWVGAERVLRSSNLWLGARGEMRLGSVSAAQALSMFGSLGLSARWVYAEVREDLSLAFRVSGSAAVLSLIHLSSDDPEPDWESRLTPVFELTHPIVLHLAGGSSLLVEAGAEFIPGTTEVFVKGSRAAVWPMWSGLGRVGFQAIF
ncbi:MAG TPA: hypothetical protein VFQ61_32205 [Polyangiaceae bacterium]|nr:hypothetical protein [Polyangiaceae bacterium]